MRLKFDLGNVIVTEFGVGRDDGSGQTFVAVSVDADVQGALREMVQATWGAMQNDAEGPAKYQPSEKHGSIEYLYLPLEDAMASAVRTLHEATNLDIEGGALDEPADMFCYFVRLTDKKGQHLTALRRASQFKGVLKKRLVRFVSDSLKLIEDSVFKLDSDFDLLVDAANVHILRPSGFEFAGKLQQAILDAVPENIGAIGKDLTFVEFDGIEAYAGKHPRAARYLASIRGQEETKNIDKSLLKKLCKQTGVEVRESKGKVTISEGHELGFLEVLDRRRYEVSLVQEKPERYRAASRRRIDG
ncbi:MAG: DUF4868 domain-containing protein [Candidatus Eisenbacteria bacterium]|nr:DUF4868 domain-containing protein [Candidatus Eisenbacteria bacterium]